MKQRASKAWQEFTPLILVFITTGLLLRVYELILISGKEALLKFEFVGLLYDVPALLAIATPVFFIFVVIYFIHQTTARIFVSVVFGMLLLLSFSLAQYFSVTLVPLGVDVFAYSIKDIRTTVGSSGGVSILTFVVLVAILALFIAANFYAFKRRNSLNFPKSVNITVTALMIVFFVYLPKPAPESYDEDTDYYAVVNKTDYFFGRVWSSITQSREKISGNDFPFLHRVHYKDNLGVNFNLQSTPPNIVLLIVEGLGRDFTGNGARWGGFTPFLDSLSEKSLYWPNALSNAGRTFGALPSLLGSLPYGKEGFMSYSDNMPSHQTLISLLKPEGYVSRFFYGGNANFDNMDVFLEYQGIDFILDEGKFPSNVRKTETNQEAYSWGFADADVFEAAIQTINQGLPSPRLDIYLTLSTHEPFKVPDSKFDALFDTVIAKMEASIRSEYLTYRNIFTCLLYTDAAIQKLLERYSERPDFNNTIFIVTGDHRLIPIPPDNKLARFHVPLLIYSPMIKGSQVFKSIVAHASVAPALLALLQKKYNYTFPVWMPFLSDSISIASSFNSPLDMALIRNKGETIDYIEGTNLFSEGRLFQITPDLRLEPVSNEAVELRLKKKLSAFTSQSIHALEENKLDSSQHANMPRKFSFTAEEAAYIKEVKLDTFKSDALFLRARTLAFEKYYSQSSISARYLLNKSPNYHDARVLLARTFAWNGQYDTAQYFLNQVLERNSKYADAYVALADIEYWKGNTPQSLSIALRGLEKNPDDVELMFRQARGLAGEKKNEAKKILQKLLAIEPKHEQGLNLQNQLQ